MPAEATLGTLVRPRSPLGGQSHGKRLRIVGWSMVWTGVLVLTIVGWRLYGTALVADASQQELEQELAQTWAAPGGRSVIAPDPVSPSPLRGSAAQNPSTEGEPEPREIAVVSETAGESGTAVGRISVPVAEVDHVFVEGVDLEDLKKGPGHMPWTPLPGQPGNAVISGHRTTYGAPFFDLDAVDVGDEITVDTAIGTHVYTVREVFVVVPTDVWVTDPRPGAWLTLTTCTPRYSASQRLIISAELTSGPNLAAVAGLGEVGEDESYESAS